jgi:hypothetical protein
MRTTPIERISGRRRGLPLQWDKPDGRAVEPPLEQAGSRRTAEDCPWRGVLLEGDRLGGDVTHQRSEVGWRLPESCDHHEPRVDTDMHC